MAGHRNSIYLSTLIGSDKHIFWLFVPQVYTTIWKRGSDKLVWRKEIGGVIKCWEQKKEKEWRIISMIISRYFLQSCMSFFYLALPWNTSKECQWLLRLILLHSRNLLFLVHLFYWMSLDVPSQLRNTSLPASLFPCLPPTSHLFLSLPPLSSPLFPPPLSHPLRAWGSAHAMNITPCSQPHVEQMQRQGQITTTQ